MKSAQLVKAARSGDKDAIEMLYKQYRDRIWFFVSKNIDSRQAAEDIVSDTFLTAIEKLSDLRCPEAFGSWLYSIAYRKCVRFLCDESATAHFDSNEEMESTIQSRTLNSPVTLPQDYIENEQTRQQLRKAIDSLKPDMRSAVIMYYFEEMTVAQVGEALGISENAAKQKLFQARRKLSAKLKALCSNGSVLCVVPLGAVMNAAFESASPPISLSGAALTTGLGVKLAAAFISGALAVGIPIALHNNTIQGDYRPNQAEQTDLAELRSEAAELLTSLKGSRFEYTTKSTPADTRSAVRPQVVQQGKSEDIGLPQLFLNNSDKWRISLCSSINENCEDSANMHYSAPLSDLKLYCPTDNRCRLYIRKYPYSFEDAGKFICIELDLAAQDQTIYKLMHPDFSKASDCKSKTVYDLASSAGSTKPVSCNITVSAKGELSVELSPSPEFLGSMQEVTFSASSYTADTAQNTNCTLCSGGSEHHFESGANMTYQLADAHSGSWKIKVSDIADNCEKLHIRFDYKTAAGTSDAQGEFTTELNIDLTHTRNTKQRFSSDFV